MRHFGCSLLMLFVSISLISAQVPNDSSQAQDTPAPADTVKSDTSQTDTTFQDSSGMDGASQRPASLEVGIIIGEPSGLSAKYWLTNLSAVDAGAAWSFSNGGNFNVFADYLFHPYYIPSEIGDFPTFFGLGATLQVRENDSFFGIRVPLGVELLWNQIPIAVFGQVAPIMEILPDMAFRIDGGVGIRFAFGRIGIQGL